MKFAVITALYLASGAAGRPTDPNQDPAYVPKPGDGSYVSTTTTLDQYNRAILDDCSTLSRILILLRLLTAI